jgi:hypothetical protein
MDSFPHLDLNSKSGLFSLISPFFHLKELQTDLFFDNTPRDQAMLEAVDYWLREFKNSYYKELPHPNTLSVR